MTLQIVLNLLIGAVWMLLHDEWSFGSFAIGYLIGMLLMAYNAYKTVYEPEESKAAPVNQPQVASGV